KDPITAAVAGDDRRAPAQDLVGREVAVVGRDRGEPATDGQRQTAANTKADHADSLLVDLGLAAQPAPGLAELLGEAALAGRDGGQRLADAGRLEATGEQIRADGGEAGRGEAIDDAIDLGLATEQL